MIKIREYSPPANVTVNQCGYKETVEMLGVKEVWEDSERITFKFPNGTNMIFTKECTNAYRVWWPNA